MCELDWQTIALLQTSASLNETACIKQTVSISYNIEKEKHDVRKNLMYQKQDIQKSTGVLFLQ